MQVSALTRPLIFGAVAGMTCALGVVLSLHEHSNLVFPTALGVAVAEMVGMAAGEWLSDSENGLTASATIGVAVGAAGILPAIPFLFATGMAAVAWSVGVLALMAGVISVARSGQRGPARAVVETYGVLAVVFGAVLLSGLVAPGGG